MVQTVKDGLATYEIIKTGFFVLIIVYCMYSALGLTIYNFTLNYVSTPGTIKLNLDNVSQTLTYVVNNKLYTHTIAPIYNDKTHTSSPAHRIGTHTIYYTSANPLSYSIGTNPTIVTSICSCVLCIFAGFALAWFLFLRSNKEVASVVGGISAANTIISNFN
jgi:hypothetical protein